MRNIPSGPVRSSVKDEALLAYETEGAGPAVLLVHGLLSDRRAWVPVTRQISHRFRAIRCDLRGCGSSPRRQPGGPTDHAVDLEALLEALDTGPVHLVGHGAGATVCASLAMRVPARVRSLAVIDPVVQRTPLSPAVQEAWYLETILRWLETSHGSVVRRSEHIDAIRKICAQQTLARLAGPDPVHTESAHPSPQPAAGAEPAGLTQLRQPLLVVFAENESPETVAMIQSLWGRAPNHRLERLPGARRPLPATASEALSALLTAFWQQQGC